MTPALKDAPSKNGYSDEMTSEEVGKMLNIKPASASAIASQGRIQRTAPGRFKRESVEAYRDSRRTSPGRKLVKPATTAKKKDSTIMPPVKSATKAKPKSAKRKPAAKTAPKAVTTTSSKPNLTRHLGRLDVFMSQLPDSFRAAGQNELAAFESALQEHGVLA